MVQLIRWYSHSHQLDFELDWSWVKLWLAQVVLAFLTEDMEKNSSSARLPILRTTTTTTTTTATTTTAARAERQRRWEVFSPCTAASASSGGVCAWGEAETPPLAGSQAAGGAGGVLSLQGVGGGWGESALILNGVNKPYNSTTARTFGEPHPPANWWAWCSNPQAGAPLHQGPGQARWWSPSGPRPPSG